MQVILLANKYFRYVYTSHMLHEYVCLYVCVVCVCACIDVHNLYLWFLRKTPGDRLTAGALQSFVNKIARYPCLKGQERFSVDA